MVRSGLASAVMVLVMPCAVQAQATTEQPSDSEPLARMEWNPRPSLRFGDVLRVDVRLKVQADFRTFSPDQRADHGTFELHRRRAALEGNVFDFIEYQIERELREDGPWRDVYANVRAGDPFEVRGGKFKIPFGLEETTSTTDLDFIFRTRGSDALAPARDIGFMVHGRTSGLVEYEGGVFRSDGENARLTEPIFALPNEVPPKSGRSVAGRLVVTPWGRGGRTRPRLGIAVTSSTIAEGLNSLRGRSVFGSGFFNRMYIRGRRIRMGTEAEWSPGPVGLRGEFIRVAEERERQGLGDINLSDLIGRSWYVSGTWVITGERKAGGVEPPRRPLFQGGAGALEIGTRVEELRFSSVSREGPAFTNPRAEHVAPSGERVWTTGVTWFWNRWFRIQANAIREVFDDERRSPVPGTRRFWSGVLRTQLVI